MQPAISQLINNYKMKLHSTVSKESHDTQTIVLNFHSLQE